jgi:hypothetical protein
MLIPFGVFSAAGAGGGGGGVLAYELISTTLLGSTTASVTFSSIPSTYKHLQIRATTRTSSGTGYAVSYANGNNTGPYNKSSHLLFGNGSTVSSGSSTNAEIFYQLPGETAGSGATSGAFGASITDVLDYANTSKTKTFRTLNGYMASSRIISLASGNWNDLTAITSITFAVDGGSYVSGSRFSLYGIKG